MKRFSFYFILFVSIACLFCSNIYLEKAEEIKINTIHKTPEEFARSIFKSISQNNFVEFSNSLLTKKDLEDIFKSLSKGITDEKHNQKEVDSLYSELMITAKANFNKTKIELKNDRIDLSKIKYKDCHYKTDTLSSLTTANVSIKFDFEGKTHAIKCVSLFKCGDKWKFGGNIFYELSDEKKLLMEKRATRIADSIVAALEAAMKQD